MLTGIVFSEDFPLVVLRKHGYGVTNTVITVLLSRLNLVLTLKELGVFRDNWCIILKLTEKRE